jgi:hypothetical protein
MVIWYAEFWNIFDDGPSPYRAEYPDIVMFADTQAEPANVYQNVQTAKEICMDAGIPFEIVSAGDLGNPPKAKTGTQGIFVPAFTLATVAHWKEKYVRISANTKATNIKDITDGLDFEDEIDSEDEDFQIDGEGLIAKPGYDIIRKYVTVGQRGQLLRQCTQRYKIAPVVARAKELAGDRPLEIWLGITLDEAERLKKTAANDRIQYAYPLVFDTPADSYDPTIPTRQAQPAKTRHDCITLLEHLGEPVVKSACFFCPYRADYAWSVMKRDDPVSFEAACRYDERIRYLRPNYELYIHKSRTPLRTAYLQASDPNVMSLGLFAEADTSATGGCDEGYCGL